MLPDKEEYLRVHAVAVRIARRVVKDYEDARDIAQQVMIDVWRNSSHIEDFENYVAKSTYRRAISHKQRDYSRFTAPYEDWMSQIYVDERNPLRILEGREALDRTVKKLKGANLDLRRIYQIEVEGKTRTEVAKLHKVSTKVIHNSIERGRRLLDNNPRKKSYNSIIELDLGNKRDDDIHIKEDFDFEKATRELYSGGKLKRELDKFYSQPRQFRVHGKKERDKAMSRYHMKQVKADVESMDYLHQLIGWVRFDMENGDLEADEASRLATGLIKQECGVDQVRAQAAYVDYIAWRERQQGENPSFGQSP